MWEQGKPVDINWYPFLTLTKIEQEIENIYSIQFKT